MIGSASPSGRDGDIALYLWKSGFLGRSAECSSGCGCAAFFFLHESGTFAQALAKISEFRAADGPFALDFHFVHAWGVDGENALDAFAVADAADGEHLVQAVAAAANHYPGKNLDTFLVPFDDSLVNIDDIADLELRRVGLEVLRLDMGHQCVLHTRLLKPWA